MSVNGNKMAQYCSIVGKQWEEHPDGAELLSCLVDKLKRKRSEGTSFVEHTMDETSTPDRQALSILSNRTHKQAFEAFLDVVIVFDDTEIIVAINKCVAEGVTLSCHKEKAVA
jgi:hypothetical protein